MFSLHEASDLVFLGGRGDSGAFFFLRFSLVPPLISLLPLLHTNYHRPLRCAVTLTKQRIITSLVFKFGVSSLTRHLDGHRERKLGFIK
jgi:hypothetical protein